MKQKRGLKCAFGTSKPIKSKFQTLLFKSLHLNLQRKQLDLTHFTTSISITFIFHLKKKKTKKTKTKIKLYNDPD